MIQFCVSLCILDISFLLLKISSSSANRVLVLEFSFPLCSYYRPGSVIVDSELLVNDVEFVWDTHSVVETLVKAVLTNATELTELHVRANSVKAEGKFLNGCLFKNSKAH